MKAVRAGKIDVVLCYNLDRLGRSLVILCNCSASSLRKKSL